MDVQMPGMDGLEATKRIRGIEAVGNHGRAFISALTANVLPEDRERCLEAGMNAFLAKPLRRAELEDVLKRADHSRTELV